MSASLIDVDDIAIIFLMTYRLYTMRKPRCLSTCLDKLSRGCLYPDFIPKTGIKERLVSEGSTLHNQRLHLINK